MRARVLTVCKVAVVGTMAGVVVLSMAASAFAQSGNQTHWGVRATVAPTWEIPDRILEIEALRDYLGPGSDVHGSELAIGFVRGRRFGGDWGFAYVRKSLSDSTRIEVNNGTSCASAGAALQCAEDRDVYTTSGAAVHGVELHSFVPWFTIKRRAQIGMNLGIGAVMAAGGTVTKKSLTHNVVFDPATRQQTLVPSETTTQLDGKAFLDDLGVPSILPVAKFELAVTGILTRSLKVRASGGINLPGVQRFSVTAIYLFGS